MRRSGFSDICSVMEVRKIVGSASDVEAAGRWCVEALKQRLWSEVWRDMVELEGAVVSVEETEYGFVVKAEI